MKYLPQCVLALAAALPAVGGESCALPEGIEDFSVVTSGDATIGAHSMYKGIAIAGTLFDGSPTESATVDATTSYITAIDGETAENANMPYKYWNFNGGLVEGEEALAADKPGSFEARLEYIARHAQNTTGDPAQTEPKVVVLTHGGAFDTESFRGPDGDSNDNGLTLVIFNTDAEITLTKTSDGTDFGPSVLAPWSNVEIENAGSVDGAIYAKSIESEEGGLQLHGDTFLGSIECSGEGGSWGDPHVRMWTGEVFDYHGACDLVLLDVPSLQYGALKVHIRTTHVADWAYIESAAVSLNDEVVEIGGWGSLIFNGVSYENDMESKLPSTFGGYPFRVVRSDKQVHEFQIQFGAEEHITIKSFKKFVGVFTHVDEDKFVSSRGLMGSITGSMLGRDGSTVFDNVNEFGQEWQVLASEPNLFDTQREPQSPQAQCVLPSPQVSESRRRLGERTVRAEAEEACGRWGMNKAACIYDVMKTGDLDLADAWSI